MAVQGDLVSSEETAYRARLVNERGQYLEPWREIQTERRLPLDRKAGLGEIRGYEVQTRRGDRNWSKSVRVYFGFRKPGVQIVRVEREE